MGYINSVLSNPAFQVFLIAMIGYIIGRIKIKGIEVGDAGILIVSLIASDLIRGHTDTIILAQLLQEDSYGYKINKRIQELTQNEYELKEATLYTAFRRLEEAGYICSYWGNENTGARRRYYTITPEGRNAYRKLCSEWEIAKGFIDVLIHSEPSNPKQV